MENIATTAGFNTI